MNVATSPSSIISALLNIALFPYLATDQGLAKRNARLCLGEFYRGGKTLL